MSINLKQRLSWRKPEEHQAAMLDDLQGNILKGHGRHATLNLFIELGGDVDASRQLIRNLGAMAISAQVQLDWSDKHKKNPDETTPPFVTVMLAHPAYAKLGHSEWAPRSEAFEAGMAMRELNDDPALVEAGFDTRADILVIVAADPDPKDSWNSPIVDNVGTKVANLVQAAGGLVLRGETGRGIFRTGGCAKPEGIEHFGYVDGRSQPLFLDEDIDNEDRQMGGIDKWNPAFPLSQVLITDPAGQGPEAFGSFFVFRKLEQNVAAFKGAEEALSRVLNAKAPPERQEDDEFAGASLVGRFETGTPVIEKDVGEKACPVPNNFNYDSDPDGRRCPLHAHIRKTNPRDEDSRRAVMARRGITYGRRGAVLDPEDRPTGGVGLLFMAYQASLEDQFEVIQKFWSNDPSFPVGRVGVDPVTGQPAEPGKRMSLAHNVIWNDSAVTRHDAAFGGHVTFRGGGYFFAPAISTLLAM